MELDVALFNGGKSLGETDATNCEVSNFTTHVDAALNRFGWSGELTAAVIVELSGDNRSILSGQLVVQGKARDKEIKIDASRVWQDAELGTTLIVNMEDWSIFTFSAGGLYSDYVEGDAVMHH